MDEHQQGCALCQATLGDLARRWDPVVAAAATSIEVPPTLVDNVMDAVRQPGARSA